MLHDDLITLLTAADWGALTDPDIFDLSETNPRGGVSIGLRPGTGNKSDFATTNDTQMIDRDYCQGRLKCNSTSDIDSYYLKMRALIQGTALSGGWYKVSDYTTSFGKSTVKEVIFYIERTLWRSL